LPDIILNNSPQLYKSCIDSQIKAEKVKMIPNPVNTETYAPLDSRNGAADIKKSLNIPEDKTIFINVSNITPSKNIEETIKLFSKYYNADKSAILLLVGKILDEEYYNDLKQILDKEKLDSSVRFTGRSNRVPELLKVSDCFIFTSKNEGMPNVVLEAMSSKLPIIIKRIPKVTDYMFQFDNGYVYRTEQEGVSYILNDFKNISKRTRIAKKARETALKVFSYPVIIDQYLNLYKSVQNSE
jgi:glycosyltransferase involved in cell wall biosynthesis